MNESVQYPRFRWLVLVSAVLGYISMQVTMLSFAPILPQIARDLAVDIGAATNLMTAFIFSGAVAMLFAGAICDRYGIMLVVVLGLFFAAAPAALMPWVGTTYGAVFWARIFEGLSSGFLLSAYGPIVAFWFPVREKGLAAGLMGSSVGVGSSIAVIAGPAVFLATGSWRQMSAWLSIVPWVGLAFAVILLMAPKPPVPSQPQPPGGPVSDGAAFKQALLSPATWIGISVTFFAAWCLQSLYNFAPAFLSTDRPVGAGFGPMGSGQLMLAVMIAGIIGPVLGGIITDKTYRGNVKPVMVICFVLSCVLIYAIQFAFIYASVPLLIASLGLAGIGVSSVYASVYLYVAKAYPLQVVGKMTGLWSAIGSFGGAVGLFVTGITVKSSGFYNTGLTLIALAGVAGLILTVLLPKPKA
jgi:MFS family permease